MASCCGNTRWVRIPTLDTRYSTLGRLGLFTRNTKRVRRRLRRDPARNCWTQSIHRGGLWVERIGRSSGWPLAGRTGRRQLGPPGQTLGTVTVVTGAWHCHEANRCRGICPPNWVGSLRTSTRSVPSGPGISDQEPPARSCSFVPLGPAGLRTQLGLHCSHGTSDIDSVP